MKLFKVNFIKIYIKYLICFIFLLLLSSCSLTITISKPIKEKTFKKEENNSEYKSITYTGGDRFYNLPPKKVGR